MRVGVEHVGRAEVADLARGLAGAPQLGDHSSAGIRRNGSGPLGLGVGQREPGAVRAGDRERATCGGRRRSRSDRRTGRARPSRKRTLSPASDSTRHLPTSGSTSHSHPPVMIWRRSPGARVRTFSPACSQPASRGPSATSNPWRAADPAGRNQLTHGLPPWDSSDTPSPPSLHPARSLHRGTARAPRPIVRRRDDEGARFHVEPGPFGQPCGRTLVGALPGGADLSRRRRRGSPWPGPRGAGAPAPGGVPVDLIGCWSSILRRSSCGPPAALTASATSPWVMAPNRRPP